MERRLAWTLAISTLVAYSYFFHFHDRWPNPNETTRLYSAISMAENFDFAINRQIERYGVIWDRAEHKGKLYSDKAPGLSFAASVPLFALHHAGKAVKKTVPFWLKHWVARFVCVILPSALFTFVLFAYLRRFLPDPYLRAGLVFVYAHGTLAATFSTLFFGHQPAAIFLFCAFVVVERLVEPPQSKTPASRLSPHAFCLAALAGLLMGWAFITEYPTALVSVCILVYAAVCARRRAALAAMVIAGLVPVALWLAYNNTCFGSPFSVGYSHLDSPQFSAVHSKGFLGVAAPSIKALGGTFVGPQRGLLFFSPVCIFGLVGLWSLWASGRRRRAILIGGATLLYAWFTSSFGYWISGDVVGPRHLTPLVPFLLIPTATFLDRAVRGGDRVGLVLLCASAAISVGMTTLCTIPFPFFPTPFLNPFRDLSLAFFGQGIFPYNAGRLLGLKGVYSAVPYLLFFFALTSAAAFWLTHVPDRLKAEGCRLQAGPAAAGGSPSLAPPASRLLPSSCWRPGVLARALPLVCLWFAAVVNILPSQVKEATWAEQQRTLRLYDPAGEDLLSLRVAAAERAARPGDENRALLLAAAGRTVEALEIFRWKNDRRNKERARP
ncbi:MAG: hypothetical protein HY897_08145 [Deltaproteobacteria bacterium]|nr:hypothetical protein [Deltaproteobacteria bacterium]